MKKRTLGDFIDQYFPGDSELVRQRGIWLVRMVENETKRYFPFSLYDDHSRETPIEGNYILLANPNEENIFVTHNWFIHLFSISLTSDQWARQVNAAIHMSTGVVGRATSITSFKGLDPIYFENEADAVAFELWLKEQGK